MSKPWAFRVESGEAGTVESGTEDKGDPVLVGGQLNVSGQLNVTEASLSSDLAAKTHYVNDFPVPSGTTETVSSGTERGGSPITVGGQLNVAGQLNGERTAGSPRSAFDRLLSAALATATDVTAAATRERDLAAGLAATGAVDATAIRAHVSSATLRAEAAITAVAETLTPLVRVDSFGVDSDRETEFSVDSDRTDEMTIQGAGE